MESTRRALLKGTTTSGATLAVASRFKPLETLAADDGGSALSEEMARVIPMEEDASPAPSLSDAKGAIWTPRAAGQPAR